MQYVFAELCCDLSNIEYPLNREEVTAEKDRMYTRLVQIGGQKVADELEMFVPMYNEIVQLTFLEGLIQAAYSGWAVPLDAGVVMI